MKINTVFIKNLNSLAGQFKIDFTAFPLNDAGLFAITGPTGSGKTTLLDAITLALYGRSPRFDKITKTQVSNEGAILTKGASEAIAEVEFEAKGKHYRAHWSISINRNGNVRDYHHEIIALPEEVNISGLKGATAKKTEEITGLNFEQFTRTVLLAQGAFAKLLEAKRSERFELLQQITGVDFYKNISVFLFNHNKSLKALEDEISQKIGLTSYLPDEVLKEMNDQIETLTARLQTEETELLALQKILQLKLRIQEDQILTEQLQLKREQLRLQWDEIEPKRNMWNRHLLAIPMLADYQNHLNAKNQWLKHMARQEALLHASTARMQELIDLNQTEAARFSLNPDDENLQTQVFDKLNALSEVLHKRKAIAVKLQELETTLQQASLAYSNKQNQFTQNLSEMEALNSRIQKGSEWLQSHQSLSIVKAQLSGWEQQVHSIEEVSANILLKAAKIGFTESENTLMHWVHSELQHAQAQFDMIHAIIADTDLKNIQQECDQLLEYNASLKQASILSKRFQLLQNEIATLLTDTGINADTLQQLEQLIQQKNEELQALETEILQLKKQKEKLTEAEQLQSVRDTLKAGDPCPVCGAEEHPGIAHYLDTLHQNATALEALLKKELLCQKQLNDAKVKRLNGLNMMQTQATRTSQLQAESASIETEFVTLKIPVTILNPDLISTEMQNSELKYQNIKSIRDAAHKAKDWEQRIEGLIEMIDSFQRVLDKKATLQIAFSPFVLNTQQQELSLSQTIQWLTKESDTFHKAQEELDRLQRDVQSLQAATTELKQQLNEMQSHNDQLKANTESVQLEMTEIQSNIAQYPTIDNPMQMMQNLTHTFATLLEAIEQSNKALNENKFELVNAEAKAISAQAAWEKVRVLNGFESDEIYTEAYIQDDKLAATLKQEIFQLDEARKEIETRYQDAHKAWQSRLKLDIYPDGIDAIKAQTLDLETRYTLRLEERQDLKSKVSANAETLLRIDAWVQELNHLHERHLPWYELSELIDADSQGKNFNEFAQLLTLKVLLMQANANMMQMQDRYRLDIADESLNESPDSLYVIDGFMGNTRRAADKTLSGGEKFMASLALALGLSDLSAGKIQLSNLFIDEGFGSLDPDTLDKAIGILESLQQERSRSIGIISHVSELKERIQVQIQILPGPNGHSKIQFQPPLLTH